MILRPRLSTVRFSLKRSSVNMVAKRESIATRCFACVCPRTRERR